MVRISLVPYSANRDQVHKLPKNRPIDSIDLNRLRKNKPGNEACPTRPHTCSIFFFFLHLEKVTQFYVELISCDHL